MDQKQYVTVEVDGQIFKLKTCLMGGSLLDDPGYPMAFYAGKLALEELGMSLLHAFRALVKIQMEIHNFTLDECAEFINLCMMEALKREEKRLLFGGEEGDTVFRMTKHNL